MALSLDGLYSSLQGGDSWGLDTVDRLAIGITPERDR